MELWCGDFDFDFDSFTIFVKMVRIDAIEWKWRSLWELFYFHSETIAKIRWSYSISEEFFPRKLAEFSHNENV